ncbi:MAG TPA: hypothetical protein VGG58_05525 [Candidatus Acidoferrum sp.]
MNWVNRFVRLRWLAGASLALALVCVCGAIRLAAQGNEQGAGNGGGGLGVGVLGGVVVNEVTHEPIGRAVVSSADHRFAVMTDERGRFEMVFKKKPDANGAVANAPNGPGGARSFPMATMAPDGMVLQSTSAPAMAWDRPDYLTARKIGFLFEMEGGTPGMALTRDQSEVTLTMMPEARVVGHVTLAGGEGALGMQILLYMRTVQAGRMRWIPVGQVRARSDGEFRFAELGAASYKLFSQELMDTDPLTADPRGQLYGYPPQYYPAAADFASAAVIHLAAGQTFQASFMPERRKYYPVRIGFASGAAGIIPEVEVSREGHKGPGYSLGYDFRDGSIGGTLPDGNYTLKLSSQVGGGLTGITNIAVNGGPAVGGVVTMMPGSSIRVRVNAEFSHAQEGGQVTVTDGFRAGGDQNARPQYVQVSLVPVEEFDNQEYPGQPPQPPALDDNDLVVANVPPGKYRVVAHESQVGYVSSMRCGDTDVQHSILEVGPGVTMPPIEITMRDDGAEVSGTVVDVANRNRGRAESTTWQPSPGVVYFVPVHEGAEAKQAWVEPNGNFQLSQLAPGSYRVLAFAQAKPFLEFTNEEAMARYDAQVITVAPGQQEHLQVSLLGEQ